MPKIRRHRTRRHGVASDPSTNDTDMTDTPTTTHKMKAHDADADGEDIMPGLTDMSTTNSNTINSNSNASSTPSFSFSALSANPVLSSSTIPSSSVSSGKTTGLALFGLNVPTHSLAPSSTSSAAANCDPNTESVSSVRISKKDRRSEKRSKLLRSLMLPGDALKFALSSKKQRNMPVKNEKEISDAANLSTLDRLSKSNDQRSLVWAMDEVIRENILGESSASQPGVLNEAQKSAAALARVKTNQKKKWTIKEQKHTLQNATTEFADHFHSLQTFQTQQFANSQHFSDPLQLISAHLSAAVTTSSVNELDNQQFSWLKNLEQQRKTELQKNEEKQKQKLREKEVKKNKKIAAGFAKRQQNTSTVRQHLVAAAEDNRMNSSKIVMKNQII